MQWTQKTRTGFKVNARYNNEEYLLEEKRHKVTKK